MEFFVIGLVPEADFGYQTGSRGLWLEFLVTRQAPEALSGGFGYSTGSRSLWMEFPGTELALEAPGGNHLVLDWLQRPLTGIFWYRTASVMFLAGSG